MVIATCTPEAPIFQSRKLMLRELNALSKSDSNPNVTLEPKPLFPGALMEKVASGVIQKVDSAA